MSIPCICHFAVSTSATAIAKPSLADAYRAARSCAMIDNSLGRYRHDRRKTAHSSAVNVCLVTPLVAMRRIVAASVVIEAPDCYRQDIPTVLPLP